MDLSQAPPTTGDAPPMSEVVNVPVGVVSGQPTSGEVADVISATMPMKRKRTPKIFFDTPAAAAAGSAAAPMTPTAPAKGGRMKIKAAAGRGPPPKAKKAATPAAAVPPAPTPSSADAREVLDEVPAPPVATSYMAMLNDSAVDLEAGIGAFDDDYADYAEDEEGDEEVDDDVVEVEAAAARRSKPGKQSNYTEIEDVTLVRAWGKVSMDACTGTDQTGKRYWQRIEDLYHKLKPRTKSLADRSYRSLEGRWNTIKPACSRWSAAMDQVADNPPSGCVASDYPKYAQLRYKDMAASKNKEFQFEHCFNLLQHLPKWKLRDEEPKCKKEAMLNMDDEEEDMSGRNIGKPEGSKKAKERQRLEGEAASFKDKMDQHIRAKEEIAFKTLETKVLITEKKKEVKLAKVAARREEAMRKAELDAKMLALKQTKAMKELLAEEKEIMMMNTKDMDDDQLLWWNETKAEIMARKLQARQARAATDLGASTPQGESPMSGGADGGLLD
ncbi:unnamed protein product [Alopecurus aequalis]